MRIFTDLLFSKNTQYFSINHQGIKNYNKVNIRYMSTFDISVILRQKFY